ncbi:hypothetical protein P7C70_g203, partial [Phenoliferia sp. Uapishka_3]
MGISTRAMHGDTEVGRKHGREVAPAIRYTQPTLTRAEQALTAVIGAPTLMVPSGIAAVFIALCHYRPDVIAITDGYHGCHGAIGVYSSVRPGVKVIELEDPFPTGVPFLCWVETPLNPTGESRSIAHYAKKTHDVGGTLFVDSTFGPPPLQDPFRWGADCVMHSATKYFGGHSDALSGTLSVKGKDDWHALWHIRTYTGQSVGSLEAWLILRSVRTLALRVNKQSQTATALAQWLASLVRAAPGSDLDGPGGMIEKVTHTSLQNNGTPWIGEGKQMSAGPATFAFWTTKAEYAAQLPHQLGLFTPATSLGGVESLIEQRLVSDPGAHPCLIRVSVGIEDFQDLKADLTAGFKKVAQAQGTDAIALFMELEGIQALLMASRAPQLNSEVDTSFLIMSADLRTENLEDANLIHPPTLSNAVAFGRHSGRTRHSHSHSISSIASSSHSQGSNPTDMDSHFSPSPRHSPPAESSTTTSPELHRPSLKRNASPDHQPSASFFQDPSHAEENVSGLPYQTTSYPPSPSDSRSARTSPSSSRAPSPAQSSHAAQDSLNCPRKKQRVSGGATDPSFIPYARLSDEDQAVPNLIGSLHTGAFKLKDEAGDHGIFFFWPDLSVRTEGVYRLRLRFLTIGSSGSRADGESPVVASTYSKPFTVSSAKKFEGMLDPTSMSKCFAKQGIRIPTRKVKSRKKRAGETEEDDGEGAGA